MAGYLGVTVIRLRGVIAFIPGVRDMRYMDKLIYCQQIADTKFFILVNINCETVTREGFPSFHPVIVMAEEAANYPRFEAGE